MIDKTVRTTSCICSLFPTKKIETIRLAYPTVSMNTATYMIYTKSLSVRADPVLIEQKITPITTSIIYAVKVVCIGTDGTARTMIAPRTEMISVRSAIDALTILLLCSSPRTRTERSMPCVMDVHTTRRI